jgi:hypothetical protein
MKNLKYEDISLNTLLIGVGILSIIYILFLGFM